VYSLAFVDTFFLFFVLSVANIKTCERRNSKYFAVDVGRLLGKEYLNWF
jgi:hypothetical protein